MSASKLSGDDDLTKRRYKLPCKMPNWSEKLSIEQEEGSQILKRASSCSTVQQRKNIICSYSSARGHVSKRNDNVAFGIPIQIRTHNNNNSAMCLSGLILDDNIFDTTVLCHGCALTGSSDLNPTRRNVFALEAAPDNHSGTSNDLVKYNQDVHICLHDSGSDKKLYVYSRIPTFDDFDARNNLFPVMFCETPNRFCKFRILNWDVSKRNQSRDDVVRPRQKVSIVNTLTNRLLTVEDMHYKSVLFGNECMVTCRERKFRLIEQPEKTYWTLHTDKL